MTRLRSSEIRTEEPALPGNGGYVKGEGLQLSTLEFGSYGAEHYVREGSEMVYLADADVLDSLALMSYKSLGLMISA